MPLDWPMTRGSLDGEKMRKRWEKRKMMPKKRRIEEDRMDEHERGEGCGGRKMMRIIGRVRREDGGVKINRRNLE